MKTLPFSVLCVLLASSTSCSAGIEPTEPVGSTRSAIEGSAKASALGFESTLYWTSSSGATSRSAIRTQGSYSLSVQPSGYTTLKSAPMSHSGSIERVTVELRLPTSEPNPWWYGDAQMFIEVPSLNTGWVYLGIQPLTGRQLGTWHTLSFDVPQATQNLLRNQTYPDLTLRIVLNVPAQSSAHLLDNLHLYELVVKTDYRVLTIHYNPTIKVGSEYLKMDTYFQSGDPRQEAAYTENLLRRASGGQINLVEAGWIDADAFPPHRPGPDVVDYTPDNFLEYCPDRDNCPTFAVDYVAIYHQYGLKNRVNSGDVDGVMLFPGYGSGMDESAMAGPNPYPVNGSTVVLDCDRNFVFHMGFCVECIGHMAESIMGNRDRKPWPKVQRYPLYNTFYYDEGWYPDQPPRMLVPTPLSHLDHFVVTDSVNVGVFLSNDPRAFQGGIRPISPGGAQVGGMHSPPTALSDYGFGVPFFGFDDPGDVGLIYTYGGDWSIDDGRLAVAAADGPRGIMNQDPPIMFGNGDVTADVMVTKDSAPSSAGLLVRFLQKRDNTLGYYVGLGQDAQGRDRIFLAKLDHGYTPLAAAPVAIEPNRRYRLKVRMFEGKISATLDGNKTALFEHVDPAPIDQGAVGFTTYSTRAFFDDLEVYPVAYSGADAWYSYPNQAASAKRVVNPDEWQQWDLGFFAWWWEHIPKNPGVHTEVDIDTGASVAGILNTWWPYMFDYNRFDRSAGYQNVLFAPVDSTPPSAVAAVELVPDQGAILLKWSEPSDNIGVTGYDVYRDGVLLQRTQAPVWLDKETRPGTMHSYTVRARDGSGNVAALSPAVAGREL